ncbi:hypothetical protein BGZ65_007717, partial [Modicella reniformis]
MTNDLTIWCMVDGESTPFSVKAKSTESVDDLKDHIKTKKSPEFDDIAADKLILWKVSLLVTEDEEVSSIDFEKLTEKRRLSPTDDISDVFPDGVKKKTINIIVRRPDEQWQDLVAKTEEKFFAPNLEIYKSLVKVLKADQMIPTTERGLPYVRSRSGQDKDQPSLLFLNLPESSESEVPPSTADQLLEKIGRRDVPLMSLFGVSGCGKTRTAIEMLCKNWGFYFSGVTTDLGSRDLSYLLAMLPSMGRYQSSSLEINAHVKVLALALILARVIILRHCLDISEREGVRLTCKRWMLLQVGVYSIGLVDIFTKLSQCIAEDICHHCVEYQFVQKLVQGQLSQLRQRLQDLTPNWNSCLPYKIVIVLDEAQNLGKEEFGTYLSEKISSDNALLSTTETQECMRPVLSPFVHGFYHISKDQSEICVVPCGTGLSIYDLEWLDGSAPITKGYSKEGRFTEFGGWKLLEEVKSYRDLVRRSLPNEEAKINFDKRVPEEAILELFSRLRGRFRPIVSSMELMIKRSPNEGAGWRSAIIEVDNRLTSGDVAYYGPGNIVYDKERMNSLVAKFPKRYGKYQRIRAARELFVLQYYLFGRPLIIDRDEALLVEVSVGRFLLSGDDTTTVLDEPFALRAAVNYFLKSDEGLHKATLHLLRTGPQPSVQGQMWEMAVLPTLVEVFHNKVLSDTALVPDPSKYNFLSKGATIVGMNMGTLGTDYNSMTLQEFLMAHMPGIEKNVPPFYYPSASISGPDIVFMLDFEGCGRCPVFIQLKLRTSMNKSETMRAQATTDSQTIQGHLEDDLRNFCTLTPKRFLGVVIAYPAELTGFQDSFTKIRQSERLIVKYGEQTIERVALKIDRNNIESLFPKVHVEALNRLKNVKRELRQDSDDLLDEP